MHPKYAILVFSAAACFAADIPVRLNSSYQVFIQARINGFDPINCNLDSGGGDRLYLDRALGAKFGVQPNGRGYSGGPSDARLSVDLRGQADLEVGGARVSGVAVLLQNRPGGDFACVIGQTLLRQYIVEVDYQDRAIRLHDPAEFHYTGPGETLPFTLENGSPFVAATMVTPNGKTFRARLAVDTGGGPALVIFSKTFADRNDLANQGLTMVPEPRYGTQDSRAKVVTAEAEQFSVGGIEIPGAIINLWQVAGFGGAGGPDGLLCSGFLRQFRLFFDYQTKTLILEHRHLKSVL